jgi:flagellar biogenesis protein FliO
MIDFLWKSMEAIAYTILELNGLLFVMAVVIFLGYNLYKVIRGKSSSEDNDSDDDYHY